ncbi:hypothetical protein Daus18300_005722 [Diaporthe australafricana]|uniref:Myb-like domain-containing protein n=1 Tax=Diaporthe australafricana TaxID=127596 RepID=A0ABR3WZK8_9PEZI
MPRASQNEENEQDKGNLATVNPNRRAGIKWTAEEEKRLWDMASQGCTNDEKAEPWPPTEVDGTLMEPSPRVTLSSRSQS